MCYYFVSLFPQLLKCGFFLINIEEKLGERYLTHDIKVTGGISWFILVCKLPSVNMTSRGLFIYAGHRRCRFTT